MRRPNTMGLTRRDVERIKAMAETVTDSNSPAAIPDLDAPWRVGAVLDGRYAGNGEVFGEWAGRVLVAFWRPGRDLSAAEYIEGERAALAALRRAKVPSEH